MADLSKAEFADWVARVLNADMAEADVAADGSILVTPFDPVDGAPTFRLFVAAPDETEALRLAYDALAEARQRCRFHGAEFAKSGTEPWSAEGLPRCDSCKQPWRVTRALAAIEAVSES